MINSMRYYVLILGSLLILGCSEKKIETKEHPKEKHLPSIIHITESGGIDDNSFNASVWRGITRFYKEFQGYEGKDFSYIVAPTLSDLHLNLDLATDEEKCLVSVAGFNFIEPLRKVARQNPQQRYLIIDGIDYKFENVKSAEFADEQSGFLVGSLAAIKSQEDKLNNPVFGFIGGMPGGVITRFEMGYLQGIKHILGSEAKIVSYYTDDWANPAKAKTITQQWINQYPDLYAIFSVAGPSGDGTIAQIKEAYRDGRMIWAIGVDSDQYAEGMITEDESVVLTSALKNADDVVYQTLSSLNQGVFVPGQTLYDLSNNGVGFSKSNKLALSDNLLEKMEKIEEAIKSGEIIIFYTRLHAENAGLLHNYITSAKDD